MPKTSRLAKAWFPKGDEVNARLKKLGGDRRSQAETARRVFPVGHHHVIAIALTPGRQHGFDGPSTRLTDHVTQKEQAHSNSPLLDPDPDFESILTSCLRQARLD